MRSEPIPSLGATVVGLLRGSFLQPIQALAAQDWIVSGYCIWLILMALVGHGAHRERELQIELSLGVIAVILWVRSGENKPGPLKVILYRTALLAGLQLPYFLLRALLPAATTLRHDEILHRVDLMLFGVEPSLWLDRWVTPQTTEWFAFFYFSYFFVLALHILPILFVEKREGLAQEFSVGSALVFGIGQSLYFLVPGYGPHHLLEKSFQHPLPQGFWMDMVNHAVHTEGALLDIFPSLHTGGPLFIAIFSFLHRDQKPYRVTWPLAAFFSANIMVATLFLRWHYAIDVFAGIVLATLSARLAPRIVAWDISRRRWNSGQISWPELFLRGDDSRKR